MTKKERKAQLMEQAINEIVDLGYDVWEHAPGCIAFTFQDDTVYYFTYSEWYSGKGVKDGRGFKKLISML